MIDGRLPHEGSSRISLSAPLAIAFALVLASSAHAATAFVKSATNRAWAASTSATFSGNVTAGNVIAVFVGWYPKSPTLTSVTATCVTGSFVLLDSATTGAYSRAAIAYGVIATTGACTVKATAAAGTTFIDFVAHEISGVDTANPVDNNQHRINVQVSPTPGTAANAVTSGPITTTTAGDYIFAAAFNESLNGGITISAGTGFTSRQQDLANVLKSEDTIQAASATIAAIFTTNQSFASFLTGIIAFQPRGGVPDTTSPTVSLTAPADNSTVGGATVTVTASASDNVGVAGVQFLLDGVPLNAEDTASPYSTTWNTTTASAGAHLLSARARDAAGNTAAAANIAVTVDNLPPSTPAGLNAMVLSPTQVELSWIPSTDDIGVTGYRVFRNGIQIGSPGGTSFQDSAAARAATYSYTVVARDAAGNLSPASTPATVTTPALIVSSVKSSSPGLTTVVITWTTDIPASGTVDYGTTAAYGLTVTEGAPPTTTHSVTLTGLTQNTTYHFVATSADGNNNRVSSADSIFTTLFATQGALFQNDVVVTGMAMPTSIRFLPNGDLLIVERGGRIARVAAGTDQIAAAPFLQLTNVGNTGTQGLMEMVLDPDFATNHFYYVFYTAGVPNRDRVSRFTATTDLTDTVVGSELVVYEDPGDAGAEHHGGALTFASDGRLLIGTGDHLNANAAQLLTSARGKILRINTDGTIPSDNPFNDGPGPNVDSIWALGLRDPARASVDPLTGTVYLTDGGGVDPTSSYEEIDVGLAGANYGWPSCEGGSCTEATVTLPIHAYPHDGRDAAVVGGFVYRGSQFPLAYQGSYFFADTVQNWIRRVTFDVNGSVNGAINFEPPDETLDGPYGDIVSLIEGLDGALYYVDQGSTDGVSKIRRIRFVSADRPPVAAASADVSSGPAPLTVQFSSAGSFDPDGVTPTYLWDFGDGSTSTAANPVHTYTHNAAYVVRLSVSDGTTATPAPPISIIAGNPPVATILTPADGALFNAGDVINFSGSATDPEDGSLPSTAFTWKVDFVRGGQVEPDAPQSGVAFGSFQIPTTGRDFSGDARYRITLTVKDSTGLQNTAVVTIYPRRVTLSFSSIPSGLNVSFDGAPSVTPFAREALVGFTHTVNAINQSQGSTTYTFASWSDGGAQQHAIVAPASNQSYVATYSASSSSSTVITLDGNVHGQKDNGATSASTVVVGPIGTPTAGATIVCEFSFDARSTFTKVSDNVNSGVYLPAVYLHTNWTSPAQRYGIYYKENVAAANTTMTLTYSPANPRGAMSCQAFTGTPPAYALDSSFIQARDGSTANPTTGANLTPFGDGRLVIGALGTRTVTAAAGAGYTVIDSNPTSRLFPEYQIQTTKTPTAAAYTAASDNWYDQMAAFAPNTGGFCDSSVIMDWTGGASGAAVTPANLTASTKGGREQPGADVESGWAMWGPGSGLTYSTSAYRPFVRTMACPFYSGTGSGTLGIKYTPSGGARAALYYFDTSSPSVSAATCLRTDLPNNDVGGATDLFSIFANTGNGARDFATAAMYGRGSTLSFYLEVGNLDSPNAGWVPIVSGRDYWLDLRYVKDGNHSLTVYEGCGASRTLVGTVSHPATSNASLASYLIVGSGGALTATKGYSFYYGAIKVDFLYGKPQVP